MWGGGGMENNNRGAKASGIFNIRRSEPSFEVILVPSVADRSGSCLHRFDADPDPTDHFDKDPEPDPTFHVCIRTGS
jgi:hypothetical protein